MSTLDDILSEARACRRCEETLPLGPRPIIRGQTSAKLLIIGQAPGTKVHETGIPWNDPSGDRLRTWLQMNRDQFYDDSQIAIMPMGFCYPGRLDKGGDAPPRPECAPAWHEKIRDHLPNIKLTLLVGHYAQKYYLGKSAAKTMTETVRYAEQHLQNGFFPTPHPSWRSTGWLKRNPWFEAELLPILNLRLSKLFCTETK